MDLFIVCHFCFKQQKLLFERLKNPVVFQKNNNSKSNLNDHGCSYGYFISFNTFLFGSEMTSQTLKKWISNCTWLHNLPFFSPVCPWHCGPCFFEVRLSSWPVGFPFLARGHPLAGAVGHLCLWRGRGRTGGTGWQLCWMKPKQNTTKFMTVNVDINTMMY